MEIYFKSENVEAFLLDTKAVKRKFPKIKEGFVLVRLEQLTSVSNLQELQTLPIAPRLHFHKLKGRGNEFAINLSPKDRLIFEPNSEDYAEPIKDIPLKNITSIVINGIEDYHD